MKRTRKKGDNSLKKLTFSQRARWAAFWRIIAYKIKIKLVARKKIASPCSTDGALLRDVWRFHSPKKLEPLEAGERGGIMVSMFFLGKIYFCVLCCGVLCWERRDAVVFLWWRCDSPLVTHMDLKKTTYKGLSMIYMTRRFFLSKSSLPT